MADVLVCRSCLATDVKLYYMYDYGLKSTFENVTGLFVSYTDRMPQHLCVFCCTLLMKCIAFQNRCRRSQDLLQNVLRDNDFILTEHIHNFNRLSQNTSLPYATHKPCNEIIITESAAPIIKIEEPYISDISVKEEEIASGSDEEPLSRKVKKKKLKKDVRIIKCADEHCNDFDSYNIETTDEVDSLTETNTEIVMLTKKEQIEEVHSRKESENYKNWLYKCDLCYKGFITEDTFRNHMIRHDPASGPEVCDVCQTWWRDARALRSHTVRSHERRYSCLLCDHACKTAYKAKEHLRWHSGHKFVCKICGATFAKSTTYLTHLRVQHPSDHECLSCGKRFVSQNGLSMHAKMAHCGSQRSNKVLQHKCELCNFEFNNLEALNKHRSNHSDSNVCDNNISACNQCGDSFASQELLKEHRRSTHPNQIEVRCEECDKTFAHDRSYALHYKRVHLGVKNAHKGPNDRQPTVVCEICGHKCFSKAKLMYHQRTHTGEKPYQCTQCTKSFSVYQRLKIHIRTHTGERPFRCQDCPKAFKHKAALNRHVRVHTGAKPYSCTHCGKSFSQSNSMKLHVATVHLKIPAPYKNRRNNKIHE